MEDANTNLQEKIQVEKGSTATTYEAFKCGIYEINLSALGKNKFNINTIIKGYELNANTGKAQELSTWWLSDYIIVKPNTSYTSSNVSSNTKCWYDENKTFISKNQSATATSPTNAKYLRVNGTLSSLENNPQAQIEEGNSATTFEEYQQIELCKIGDYEDKIYSSNGRFYLYKKIGKVVLDGSETMKATDTTRYNITLQNLLEGNVSNSNVISNYYTSKFSLDNFSIFSNSQANTLSIMDNRFTSTNDFKTWLSNHNTTIYYVLATPTTTEITQENYPSLYNALKQIQDYLTAYKINKEFILGYSSPEIEY